MFEDISYDLTDDTIETSFTNNSETKSVSKMCKNIEQKVEKREVDLGRGVLEKTKLRDFPDNLNPLKFSKIVKSPSKVVKRKFPGPAGLLPENCNVNKSISEILAIEQSHESVPSEEFFCSQQTYSIFEEGPWQNMVNDFQNQDLLYETFTISWIKSNFSMKKLQRHCKAPFLACVIDRLELTDAKIPTVKVLLKDRSGSIQGTVLYSLYEEYSKYLTVGSVLVIIQFGVLSAHNSYCLTITPKNLLSIYHLKLKNSCEKLNKSDVQKIILQDFTIGDIWKKHKDSQKDSVQIKKDITITSYNKNQQTRVSNNSINKMNSFSKYLPNRSKTPEFTCDNLEHLRKINSVPIKPDGKNVNLEIKSNEICIKTDRVHSEIWKDLFQDVDTDALFDDF